MLCRRPYVAGLAAYGCGQCLPCRINRRRVWTHRILLEATQHARSVFVTLTYDEASVPSDGSLRSRDLTLWLKRLRTRLAPVRFRYFAVGEYGDLSWRPHYHVVLFGVGPEVLPDAEAVWQKGFVHVAPLSRELCAYVAGYVVKKLTSATELSLQGRSPEFSRMSRCCGIGATAMADVARALRTPAGARRIALEGNVPDRLMHGSSSMPLGRYLMARLRSELNVTAKPEESRWCIEHREEMRALRERSQKGGPSFRELVVEAQRCLQMETKAKIRSKRVTL